MAALLASPSCAFWQERAEDPAGHSVPELGAQDPDSLVSDSGGARRAGGAVAEEVEGLQQSRGMGRCRPEVPWPGGGGGRGMVTAVPRRCRGAAGASEGRWSRPLVGRSVGPSVLGSRRGYSAALASAPSAFPSTSSSEHSPVPFRAIRRGTTNGRSPRLGSEAEGQRAGQGGRSTAHTLQSGLQRGTGCLTPRGEKQRGAPGGTGWLPDSRRSKLPL